MPRMDPDDRNPDSWRRTSLRDGLRCGSEVRTVVERAHATRLPYQYEYETVSSGPRVADEFGTREYTNARVRFNCGVEGNGRVKLLTQGHFWGGPDRHQRFKAQYRRAPPPTETVPFDGYETWVNYRYGVVERDGDSIEFVPSEDGGEEVRPIEWAEMFAPVQRRLVELELVRNPPLARYVLEDIGEWEAFASALRYDVDAFDVGP
ncbi:hypothetical protein GJ629_03890 [Halapricum sp. CBA1109]|nr:hypothetical protein [Halapricum sp. CBA1109]